MSKVIKILGLGAGDINQLPLGLYRMLLKKTGTIFARTIEHPVVRELQEEGVQFTSFDHLYEASEDFSSVYEAIVKELVEQAAQEEVLYAVPGHPMLAEATTQLLLNREDVTVEILGGQSYLDDMFRVLKIDPIDGFQFLDATSVSREEINYRHHLIFCQVYDTFRASDLKLLLLEDLPADFEVTVIEAAGTTNEQVTTVPLEDLDRTVSLSNLTSVYVPPAPTELLNHQFANLRDVMRTLRGPNGCPWDREQTHESIRRYLIEETYELIDAINAEDDENIIEELGDVLLQVMLHSQIGEDDGYFSIDDVIQTVTEKMIYRHPHVFGTGEAETISDVDANWEALKEAEKSERESILEGIPESLPALLRAFKLQKKARKVGFNWDNAEDIWKKLDEELAEFKDALAEENLEEIEAELGDVLFVLVNLAIQYKVNPEFGLTTTNEKFIRRFQYVEEKLQEQHIKIKDASLKEMDAFWDEAKQKERN